MAETLAKGKQKTRAAVDWISVLLVCLFPIITGIIFFRLLQMTGVPNWFYILQGLFFAGSLAQAILFLIRYISSRTYLFVMKRTGREISPQGKRRISDKRIHAILIFLISFVVFTVGYFNIDIMHDTRYEVTVEAESEEAELNICLIADIHAGSGTWEYTYDDLVTMIDAAEPDVLLIAGDAFDETTGARDIENFAWALQEIRPPKYGMYYVYGNHDNNMDDWAANLMREMGATVLEDEITIIGKDIQLMGCMDAKYGAKDLNSLFEDCHPDPDKPILVLTHRPKGFQQMSELGANIAMAGHTHGFDRHPVANSTELRRKRSGKEVAIISCITALFFFILHVQYALYYMTGALLLCLITGLQYERDRNIWGGGSHSLCLRLPAKMFRYPADFGMIAGN